MRTWTRSSLSRRSAASSRPGAKGADARQRSARILFRASTRAGTAVVPSQPIVPSAQADQQRTSLSQSLSNAMRAGTATRPSAPCSPRIRAAWARTAGSVAFSLSMGLRLGRHPVTSIPRQTHTATAFFTDLFVWAPTVSNAAGWPPVHEIARESSSSQYVQQRRLIARHRTAPPIPGSPCGGSS